MQRRGKALTASLLLGAVWGIWHLPRGAPAARAVAGRATLDR
jgi:hypothetical protein